MIEDRQEQAPDEVMWIGPSRDPLVISTVERQIASR